MLNDKKTKDPNAILDFHVDWTLWLNGGTLTDSEWIVPTGITKDSDTFTVAGITTAWFSGGTVGVIYTIVNRITATNSYGAGAVEDQTMYITIVEK